MVGIMSKQGEISDGQAASDAIRKHTVQLLEPITFGTTIDELFSNELIDEQVYEAATSHNLTTQDKGRKIIREVQKKVKANPKLFVAFCDILACNDTTSDISKTLRGKYNTCHVRFVMSYVCDLYVQNENRP